jgi:hypothetical protein
MLSGQGQGLLIDEIDIGALFSVNLYGNKMGVDEGGDLVILETFMGHDMAPMAGRIADRQQNRAVLAFGLQEGRLVPGPPMHRIILVLKQIGAGFMAEEVHLFSGGSCTMKVS